MKNQREATPELITDGESPPLESPPGRRITRSQRFSQTKGAMTKDSVEIQLAEMESKDGSSEQVEAEESPETSPIRILTRSQRLSQMKSELVKNGFELQAGDSQGDSRGDFRGDSPEVRMQDSPETPPIRILTRSQIKREQEEAATPVEQQQEETFDPNADTPSPPSNRLLGLRSLPCRVPIPSSDSEGQISPPWETKVLKKRQQMRNGGGKKKSRKAKLPIAGAANRKRQQMRNKKLNFSWPNMGESSFSQIGPGSSFSQIGPGSSFSQMGPGIHSSAIKKQMVSQPLRTPKKKKLPAKSQTPGEIFSAPDPAAHPPSYYLNRQNESSARKITTDSKKIVVERGLQLPKLSLLKQVKDNLTLEPDVTPDAATRSPPTKTVYLKSHAQRWYGHPEESSSAAAARNQMPPRYTPVWKDPLEVKKQMGKVSFYKL